MPSRALAHAALLRCKDAAPHLEHLSIHVGDSLEDAPQLPFPLFGGHTPRLRYCSFASFDFAWDARAIKSLRVLKLDGYWNASAPSTAVMLDILRACPGLEELSLRNLSELEDELCNPFTSQATTLPPAPPRSSTIRLPRLKTAIFSMAGGARVQNLLSHLVLPSLESLELTLLSNIDMVLSCMDRQAAAPLPLRRLRIDGCEFSEVVLLRFLSRTTALTTLELVDMDDVSSFLLKVSACLLAKR